jgi:hypothetical protein
MLPPLQGGAVDEKSLAGGYMRYRLVGHSLALIRGSNPHMCPACTLGICRVHIDGNSKLLTMDCGQRRSMPSAYNVLPGGIMEPDWSVGIVVMSPSA